MIRTQIGTGLDPARYRVPDVCVTLGEPEEDIFSYPALYLEQTTARLT
jgi:hypothetical protein